MTANKRKATNTPATRAGVKPDVQMLQVSALRPHPRQSELVGDMPPADFDALVADIDARGIQTPLIVLADQTTVVCGNQRLRAARQLGLLTVPCIISHWADPSDLSVTELLLTDNLRRRELGPLQKARYVAELARIECRHRELWSRISEDESVRDAIGKELGRSGRHVDRYLAVMRTPVAIQDAHDSHFLTIVEAGRVATLSRKVQETLASAIGALVGQIKTKGTAAFDSERQAAKKAIKALIKSALDAASPPKPEPPESPDDALYRLRTCLLANVAAVTNQQDAIIAFLCEEIDPDDYLARFTLEMRSRCRSAVAEIREACASLDGTLSRIVAATDSSSGASGVG